MEWGLLPETVCRMAGFLLHFHRPWWLELHSSVYRRHVFIFLDSVYLATGPNSKVKQDQAGSC